MGLHIYWFASNVESFDVLVMAYTADEAKKFLVDKLAKDEDNPKIEDMELFRIIPKPQYGDVIPF